MAKIDKKILDTFKKTIPQLSELEKEKLLSFGEGMAFKAGQLRNDCAELQVGTTLSPSKDPPKKDSA